MGMAGSFDSATQHLLQSRPYPVKLSIVVPLYNEEETLPFLRAEMEHLFSQLEGEAEIVLVNDGSTDATLSQLVGWAGEDARVKVLHLSRNFGHQLAATAGLDYAAGDAVVLMDADLQDPPDVVHAMIQRYREGYDVVYGQRASRAGESVLKRFTAWVFYRLMRVLVYSQLPPDTGDFRLISRSCLDALKSLQETHRFLRGMVAWIGYPQTAVLYDRRERIAGATKYPFRGMLAFAWTAVTSFSSLPLRFSLLMGIATALLALEELVRALLAHLLGWYTVPGWASLMIVTSLIGSVILISLGIIGEYVGKIYEGVKGRPLYLVARTFPSDIPRPR
jgi:dolichol-phosphate mannosyltransferase